MKKAPQNKTVELWTMVISLTVLIFIGWIFSLKYSFQIIDKKDSFISIIKKTYSEVNKSFKEARLGIKQSPLLQKDLMTNEEVDRLKKKVLEEYEEQTQKNLSITP
ncbi:MAG: hypothetical protein PHE59_02995 [Patescibacteria group bacterium]|nr:hypothetical protein [Patescibacteria group bacterium]MDD5164132.1 hypothetical protein [Patescibacteria group bacterium]MDD5534210.1 hypothetical protein [Patescibacteria group bacterium]